MPVLIFVFLSFFIFQAQAKFVVIADVDDTIKISHVLDLEDAVLNAAKTDSDNAFKGMANLLQSIEANHADAEFFYVSNAPEVLMSLFHRAFLLENGLPKGKLLLNPSFGGDHKITTISKIIEAHPGDQFILLGDNGENDVLTYDYLANKYFSNNGERSTRWLQYIRIDYAQQDGGKLLRAGQQGFVSAAEVAMSLYERQILPWPSTSSLVHEMNQLSWSEQFFSEDTAVLRLPRWVRCEDHKIASRWLTIQNSDFQKQLRAIEQRCHQ